MTDIDIYQPTATVAVPDAHDTDSWITVVADIIKIANVIYDTPFVPDGLRGSAPAVAAAMLAGREMGLGIMTSLANIDVIRGKPTQKALLMRAMIQSRGHKWEDVDVSDTRVVIKGCRKGESAWMEASFTADQARKAGIDLGKYPVDKLYARASVRLARRKFADVIMGMPYSEEDLEDGVADEGEETPAIAAPAPKPAQRTARRRQAAPQTASPAEPQSQAADAQTPPAPAAGEAPMPPLPGEDPGPTDAAGASPSDSTAARAQTPNAQHDEPDEPDRGDRHRKLVGIVRAHFKRLGYTEDDTVKRISATAKLAGTSGIGSTNDLDEDELSTVADALARCKNREALDALLKAAADVPGADHA